MTEEELNEYRKGNAERERARRAKRTEEERAKIRAYKEMWRKRRLIQYKG